MYFFSTPQLDVELTKENVIVYVVPDVKLPATLSVAECTVTINEHKQIIFDIDRDKIDLYNDGSQPTLVVKQKIESRPSSAILVENKQHGEWEDVVAQDTQTDTIHFPASIMENVEKKEAGAPPSKAWTSMDTPEGIFQFSQLMAGASGVEAQFETPTQQEADKMNELMGSIADRKCEVENITFDLENSEISSDTLSSNP